MGRRRRRQRKAGRKVYYQRWSQANVEAAKHRMEGYQLTGGKQRFASDASLEARARREAHLQEGLVKTLGLWDGVGDPRFAVQNQLAHMQELEGLDRHMVVENKHNRILILFYNKAEDQWWFVERNPLTGEIKRSIDYDDREQAWMFYEIDKIDFA